MSADNGLRLHQIIRIHDRGSTIKRFVHVEVSLQIDVRNEGGPVSGRLRSCTFLAATEREPGTDFTAQ